MHQARAGGVGTDKCMDFIDKEHRARLLFKLLDDAF